jgi:hypothetical protein
MDNDFNRREEVEKKEKRKEVKSHQIGDREITTFTPT